MMKNKETPPSPPTAKQLKQMQKELKQAEKQQKKEQKEKEKQEKKIDKLKAKEQKAIEKARRAKKESEAKPIGGSFKAQRKQSWFKIIKNKMFPSRTMLVLMELRTGSWRMMTINVKYDTFRFMEGEYIIDPEQKEWCYDAKMYFLRYHQDFALPIKQEVKVKEVRDTLEAAGTIEVIESTNPLTLARLSDSRIAEQVMKGQAMDDFFKTAKTLLIILVIELTILLFLFVQKSGMLKSVNLPFL